MPETDRAPVAYKAVFLAAALLRRLRARGIAVPREVAVVGYLNHYLCDHVDPPLTSVDLRHHAAAQTMVTILEDMVRSSSSSPPPPTPPPHCTEPLPARRATYLTPVVVVRESTATSADGA